MLRSRDVAATVAGAMIGSGIFIAPDALLGSGAPPWLILTLFGGAGIVAILGAFTLVSLARAIPGNGGPYLYLRRLHGRLPALFNWSRFWVMQTGALAVLSLFAAQFILQAAGFEDRLLQAVLAIGIIVSLAVVNSLGIRTGARVQIVITVAKIAAILTVALAVFAVTGGPGDTAPTGEGDLGGWLLLVVFAFGGWTQVTFIAGETQGDLRRPIVAAIAGVTIVYLVAVAAMLGARGGEGPLPLAAAEAAFGPSGRTIMAIVIATTAIGTTHTMTMTGPRLYEAAARDGAWWHPFARRNRHDAPGMGLLFQAEWACFLVAASLWAGDAYWALIGGVSTAIWTFHAATAFAWFRVRPGSPVAPVLFLMVVLGVLAVALLQDIRRVIDGAWGDVTSLYALLIIGSGVPYAIRVVRRRADPTQP